MKAMKRTKSLVAIAVGMCLAGVVMAQSTTGDVSGSAPAGSTVVLKSTTSGFTREVPVGTNGQFRVQSLPAGVYDLTVGNVTRKITVLAGQTSDADLNTLATVTVVGRAKSIDTTSTETRTTFTAEQLDHLPIARNVTAVSLLTPGTASSSGYFGPASFGGASAAENSYYINGFNVTNMYDILSFTEVPYQAIGQLDIQTGGYGARYGLSTGGVTSVNVKRGTNEFKGGISYTFSPNSLRSKEPAVDLSNGAIFRAYRSNESDSNNVSAWVGGPIIKDKLFFFFLGSQSNSDNTTFAARGTGYAANAAAYTSSLASTGYDYKSRNPYAVLKLDWNINDNNILEYTGFHNKRKQEYQRYTAAYSSTALDATVAKTVYTGKENLENGGDTNILKWTSYLTDNLTLSAQYGKMKNTNSNWTTDPNGVENKYNGDINTRPSCPYVLDYRDVAPSYGARVGCATSSSVGIYGGYNERTAGRVDVDWTLGSHKLALGYNSDTWKSKQGTMQNIIYLANEGSFIGENTLPANADNIFEEIVFATGGTVKILQKSYYVEDNWNVTKDLMLYLGLRNDSFENQNSAGKTFVKQSNIWQPRLGFTLDLVGGGNSKLYATLGRYSLPIAANVALRGASASYYTDKYYTYNGTTNPVTRVPTSRAPYQNGALDQIVNGEDGSVPDPNAVSTKNLKPYTQDELIVGYQQLIKSDNALIDGWQFGVKGTYRKVKDAIDDTCDARAIYNAAMKAGLGVDKVWADQWTVPGGIPGCYIYNPGRDLNLTLDVNLDGKPDQISVPGADLGPKAKRDYKSLTFSAEKRAPTWYLNASYTWSRLTGNLEGLVKSTNGQSDTGTTSDFDFKEIMIGADGKLFNDHTHSFKVYGSYKVTPEWEFGMNAVAQSGSPVSCLGGGTGSFGTQYGYTGVFHVCGTGASLADRLDDPISPVGSAGRTPWTITFSPNINYTPTWAKGLSLQATVFNLFNNIKAQQVFETNVSYNNATARRTYFNYGKPKYFNDPRYVQVKAQYEF